MTLRARACLWTLAIPLALGGCGGGDGTPDAPTATPGATPTAAPTPTVTPVPLKLCTEAEIAAAPPLGEAFDPFDPGNDTGNLHVYLALDVGAMDTTVDQPVPSEDVPAVAYIPCAFTLVESRSCSAVVFEDAQCRYKGNTTFDKPKRQYKVKLDSDHRLLDYRRFNLHSGWKDATLMREKLAYDLFQAAGVPAPRANHALVFLRDTGDDTHFAYQGLYTLVEQVDKPFLRDRFGGPNDEGNLYKAYYGYKGRERGFGDLKPVGTGTEDNYRGGNGWADTYEGGARAYRLKTNESEFMEDYTDLAALIASINGLSGAPALETVFDVEGYLQWLAINTLIGGWDNYWLNAQNYYLYRPDEGSLWRWIPWDHDNTWGNNFQDHNGFHIETEDIYYGDHARNALTRVILADPAHRARYEALLREALDGPFDPGALSARIDALSHSLAAAAAADPLKQYPMDLFYGNQADVIVTYSDEDGEFGNQAHHLGLKDYVEKRWGSVAGQVE